MNCSRIDHRLFAVALLLAVSAACAPAANQSASGRASGDEGGGGTLGEGGTGAAAGQGGGRDADGIADANAGLADTATRLPDVPDATLPVPDGPKPVVDARPADRPADRGAATDSGGACSGPNPHEGFTEYQDTFNVQHPYDLPESDRFSNENGVYTAWIMNGDKPYGPNTPTGPRTEMRWVTNWTTGEHMWEADVLIDGGTTHSAIMQVKATTPGAPLYLQVNDGTLRNSVRPEFLNNTYDRWIHINAAFNPDTGVGRVWADNCLVLTIQNDGKAEYYFKNGVYGCDGLCRTHFKNIQFWKK